MKLKYSRVELEKTRKSLDAIRMSKTLDEYEENWRNFLANLEKVWIKSE